MSSEWQLLMTTIGGLIVILLAIIGALLKIGLDGIRQEIHDLWTWAKESDKDRKWIHEQLAAINTRCSERYPSHPGGRRAEDPEERP